MEQLTPHISGILLAYTAFLLAIASPGPNILAVIGTSMSVNRSSGIALAMGVALGSFSWGILTVIGLSAVLAAYASVLFVIKIFGGMYLLWLGYKSLKSAFSKHDLVAKELEGGKRSHLGYAKRGYIIQMTNPKAALAWIAIISLGMPQEAPMLVGTAIVVGTFILSVIIHVLYAVAFSTPLMVRIYGKARRVIQGILGTFFGLAGLKLILDRG